jgi:hypothetical protein
MKGMALYRAALLAAFWGSLFSPFAWSADIDLSHAAIVTRPGDLPKAEKTAAEVLADEVQKRTGILLKAATKWPLSGAVIAITSQPNVSAWSHAVPVRHGEGLPEQKSEGYRMFVQHDAAQPIVWIVGADARGTLFGVGNLLRVVNWSPGKLSIDPDAEIATAPVYPIRGHQLGYRAQANSYDAWSPAQFQQYIRELTFFGVNTIENIPFQDDRKTDLMKVSRSEMNRAISEICDRYGIDYGVWAPADFDLNDRARREQMLQRFDEFFKETKRLDYIFFPGGDPGHNPPELVLPFLEDVAKRMRPLHPDAKIWLSLQWFKGPQIDYIYNYIAQKRPDWFAGLVAGPSSPPIPETRERLPKQYKLRWYPDITHNKLCQYQVPEWDQAFALTLGREAINPRPAEFARIFNRDAAYTDGFVSYSDGAHDDVNKIIWSALSWDPTRSVRDILTEYARVYFNPAVANEAADGILALENNWHGSLVDNGSVEGTLRSWQHLEKAAPQLQSNWRWQMCLLRAYYDAYIRHRLINETALEAKANTLMAEAPKLGPDRAMNEAAGVLNTAISQPVSANLRQHIFDLCDQLFHSIGLQTSVAKYHAIGEERGAVLDFVDYPLNNRWWLEDQFKQIRQLSSYEAKVKRLQQLALWAHPGPGSFYDDLGNIAHSPHAIYAESGNRPNGQAIERDPTFWWWDEGKSRARLSWQVTQWPRSVTYEGLDPNGIYVVRSSGYGQALLRINGDRVEPIVNGTKMGEWKEFRVAEQYLKNRKLVLTWDAPRNEENLNWRQHSRLAEVWLIKK